MMVDVTVDVDELGARTPDRLGELLNDALIPALTDVRYALEHHPARMSFQ